MATAGSFGCPRRIPFGTSARRCRRQQAAQDLCRQRGTASAARSPCRRAPPPRPPWFRGRRHRRRKRRAGRHRLLRGRRGPRGTRLVRQGRPHRTRLRSLIITSSRLPSHVTERRSRGSTKVGAQPAVAVHGDFERLAELAHPEVCKAPDPLGAQAEGDALDRVHADHAAPWHRIVAWFEGKRRMVVVHGRVELALLLTDARSPGHELARERAARRRRGRRRAHRASPPGWSRRLPHRRRW